MEIENLAGRRCGGPVQRTSQDQKASKRTPSLPPTSDSKRAAAGATFPVRISAAGCELEGHRGRAAGRAVRDYANEMQMKDDLN